MNCPYHTLTLKIKLTLSISNLQSWWRFVWMRICPYEDTWSFSPGTLSGCFCIGSWMINHLCSGSVWQGQCRVQHGEVHCYRDYWCCKPCDSVALDFKKWTCLFCPKVQWIIACMWQQCVKMRSDLIRKVDKLSYETQCVTLGPILMNCYILRSC